MHTFTAYLPYLGPGAYVPVNGAVYDVAELLGAGRGLGTLGPRTRDHIPVTVRHLHNSKCTVPVTGKNTDTNSEFNGYRTVPNLPVHTICFH